MADFSDELVFVPLGGVGEIGMNMAAYGFGSRNSRKWIVVDCGVTFAGPHQPGIELIMADPSFLEDNADDVLGLILTHSHEDHYGAVLDLWPAFDRPVYATAFTAAMLSAKRAADNIVDDVAVWTTRPTGVVMARAQLSGIECATLIASMVNGPSVNGWPTRIGHTATSSTILSAARLALSIAAVKAVA